MGEKLLTQIMEANEQAGYGKDITAFRGYAEYMMFPDPTYIELSSETADIATDAVNQGLDIHKVYKALRSGYQYDELGREFISFPDAESAKQTLDAMLHAENIVQEQHGIEEDSPAGYRLQMQ